ncbi:MAG TPA: zinc-ribbon domain-containing protein [Acidisoma sp.]|uniref:zinc-ribbon domain-containing protein n=1 Tax=Acidisoma sp. TaxID=1872115 RepID=UPI002CBD1C4B|nr:zinc-ribbon domain-containing protein [Acidisoma sp.]HTI01863.1 zinc-ribbon domain-containing protein [Acidisoma sp.]
MRLVCRECSAIYEAPDNLFGAQPREVRCNRCGYQWTVVGAVKAVPGLGPQQAMAQPEPAAAGGMPPDLMRDPSALPAERPPSKLVSAQGRAAAASPAAPLAARNSPLADSVAGPLPGRTLEPAVAEPPASTRSLLKRDETEAEFDMGDPEERRLSHELSFGETERAPVADRPSWSGWRGAWLVAMLIIVLVIAAILFEPQVVGAVPALGRLYAAVGL